MSNESRDSFIFYRSFYESMLEIDDKIKVEVYNAICDYSLNGVEHKLSGTSKAIFTLIKPQIQANTKRYENGKRGGRPKINETKTEPNQNQTKTKVEPNKNDNENVNKNVNINLVNKIEERKLKFSLSLEVFSEVYPRNMLSYFYKYCTEPNKSNSKFRQELEKTWDLSRRLETWAKNNKNFNSNRNGGIKQTAEQQLTGLKEEFFRNFNKPNNE
jgi:hypothetical protein